MRVNNNLLITSISLQSMIRKLKEIFFSHEIFSVSFSAPFTPENFTISPGSFAEDRTNMASDWHAVRGDIKKAMEYYDENGNKEAK